MRGHSQIKKTLGQVLESHFMSLQHETSISGAVFVASVREHYESSFSEHARGLEWSKVSDPTTRMTRDYEKFKRWFDEDIKARFPLEILESVIAAFPAERRFHLQIELAERQGMVATEMPSGDSYDSGVFLGKIAKETGEAIIAISTLLDGGDINSRSISSANHAVREINEAISALSSMKILISSQPKKETVKS